MVKAIEISKPLYETAEFQDGKDNNIMFLHDSGAFTIYMRLYGTKGKCLVIKGILGNERFGKVFISDMPESIQTVNQDTKYVLEENDGWRIFIIPDKIKFILPQDSITFPKRNTNTLNARKTVARKPIRKSVRKTKRA